VPPLVCLCECKHWASPVSKDVVHSFRTVVADFGASRGFLISSGGFQKGAYEAAEFSNVRLMKWDEFEVAWMKRWIDKYLRPTLYEAQERLTDYTEPLLGRRLTARADALQPVPQQKFIAMRRDVSKGLRASLALHFGAPWNAMMPNTDFDLPFSTRTPIWAIEHAPNEIHRGERQGGDT
jgi:restriction system protein